MQDNLLQQGIELMLFGMGTVFVFLALLVLITTAMSALLRRYIKPEPAPVLPGANAQQITGDNDEQLIAVIGVAIHKYRSRHKR